jgi:transcriptional regulator with XRE-family HTH domain
MDDRRKFTLKGLRVNNNWTIPEAAVKYGVSVDTVKNYEAYRTFPDVPIIENILKATGLRYDDIVFLPINVEPQKRK